MLSSPANVKSVRTKILAGFLSMCVLMGMLGMLAMSQIGRIFSSTNEISDVHVPTIDAIEKFSDSLRDTRVVLYEVGIHALNGESDLVDTHITEYRDLSAEADDTLASDQISKAAAETTEFQSLKRAWSSWKNYVDVHLMPELTAGHPDIFLAQLASDEASGGKETYDAVIVAARDAQAVSFELVDRADRQAHAVNETARRTTLAIIVGAISIALALEMALARSIVQPLRRSVEMLSKVAEGDLTQRLEVRSRDEVGQMANALNTSVEATQDAIRAIRE